MKLLGIISVGFDITDRLLIRFSAFVRYWRKDGSTMRQYVSCSDFKKAYDSVKKEILLQFSLRILGTYEICWAD
jgi:hypothetical protein